MPPPRTKTPTPPVTFRRPGAREMRRIHTTTHLTDKPSAPAADWTALEDWEWERLAERLGEICWTAILGGRAVGFLVATETDPGRLSLGFALFPEHRGHGHMAHVLDAAVPFLRETYPGTAILVSAREENEAARRTLERVGFLEVATETRPPLGTRSEAIRFRVFELPPGD